MNQKQIEYIDTYLKEKFIDNVDDIIKNRLIGRYLDILDIVNEKMPDKTSSKVIFKKSYEATIHNELIPLIFSMATTIACNLFVEIHGIEKLEHAYVTKVTADALHRFISELPIQGSIVSKVSFDKESNPQKSEG